jgi:DNA invertase Pin-like site-specific DNA recombinase
MVPKSRQCWRRFGSVRHWLKFVPVLPMCLSMEGTMADLVRAAQYLRVSTEHQQYSLENQAAAIQRYAESRGFVVVRTYRDAAKSGVRLKHRAGLGQLLKDVVDGAADYRTILVYDVSRWGRFQDTDESAHYEFVCKAAGIPVHYCAETFSNDGSLPSLIMKALKRTMAGEYSRELGVKVLAGQQRLARLGFKQGGMPGYGLRRMLVSPDRQTKQPLAFGERKSIATDRVILVPGPEDEVQMVREIYRMLISDGMAIYAIARDLNRRGIQYQNGSRWTHHTVAEVLTNPKYAGSYVYGRSSRRLYTPVVKHPMSDWILTEGAFQPVVNSAVFVQAQQILAARTVHKSNEAMLDGLRRLLARKGRLTLGLIKDSDEVPSPSTYRQHFGSLRKAYELIGYGHPSHFDAIDLRRRTQALRDQLINGIVSTFPNEVTVVRRGGRWRPLLRLWNRVWVSVLIARTVWSWNQTFVWQVDPARHERKYLTVLARLDAENRLFFDFHVLPAVDRTRRFHIRENDLWLSRGEKISDIGEFCQVTRRVLVARGAKGRC